MADTQNPASDGEDRGVRMDVRVTPDDLAAGDVGPGAVVGSGSVRAEQIAGRDLTVVLQDMARDSSVENMIVVAFSELFAQVDAVREEMRRTLHANGLVDAVRNLQKVVDELNTRFEQHPAQCPFLAARGARAQRRMIWGHRWQQAQELLRTVIWIVIAAALILLATTRCAPAPAAPTSVPWNTPVVRIYCLGTTTRAMAFWRDLHYLAVSAGVSAGTRVAVYLDFNDTRYYPQTDTLVAQVAAWHSDIGGWWVANHGGIVFDDESCVAAALADLDIAWPLPTPRPGFVTPSGAPRAVEVAPADDCAVFQICRGNHGDWSARRLTPAAPAPTATFLPTRPPATWTPPPTPTMEQICLGRLATRGGWMNVREAPTMLAALRDAPVIGRLHAWQTFWVFDAQHAADDTWWALVQNPLWAPDCGCWQYGWAAAWLLDFEGEEGVICPAIP